MAHFEIFLLPEELDEIIGQLAREADLKGLLFVSGRYRVYDPTQTPSEFLKSKQSVDSIFLMPSRQRLPVEMSDDTIRPREKGWIQIDPGGLVEKKGRKVLTLTQIASEDRKNVAFKPSKILRRLRGTIGPTVAFGVRDRQDPISDKSVFKHIGYSTDALRLLNKRVLWKQHPDYDADFVPAVGVGE
jgi:hypothetical protein